MLTYISPSLNAATLSKASTDLPSLNSPASSDVSLKKDGPSETSATSDYDESQLYYWTTQWQEAEKRARADIQSGRVTKLNRLDEIETHFKEVAKASRQSAEERNDFLQ